MHPYKSKSPDGRATARKRYAEGGDVKAKPPLTPDSPQFNPDSVTGRFPTRSPRRAEGGEVSGYSPDMKMIGKGLDYINKTDPSKQKDDPTGLPMKLDMMALKPMKASGGQVKMPMNLKMMKLKGMK